MRQKIVLSILLLLSIVAPRAALADSFKVSPTDLELGKTGTLQFVLDNPDTEYYGFQANVTLPTGLKAEGITLSDRALGGDYEVNSNTLSNGTFIMGAFSASHKPLTGTSGVLVNMTVSAAETFTGGDVTVSNILMISKDNKDVPLADATTAIGVAVTGVTLSSTTLTITEGETGTLTATVAPGAATVKTVTWSSSDTSVATVVNGVVTAVKAGEATITATTANGKTATCAVTVKAKVIEVAGVSLDQTELNMTEDDTAKLTATIDPTNATDQTLTWSSSDTAVATVDAEGNVKAVKKGTAIITVASKNGKTASCTVNVAAKVIAATGVTLSATTAELKVGGTVTLTATVAPENATDKTVTWKSSDESIATVENGVVTAKALGKATITATCGSVSATCEVTVAPTPVESITLSNKTLAMSEGETANLTATVAPATATDKTISWSSSDETVATVSATGEVTAVKAGTATITATSTDGVTATCTVTVEANIISVTAISISKTEMTLTEGDKDSLTATITPSDATDKSVTWTSSDSAVATVDAEGNVTAVKAGTATITAASSNGKTATCAVTVKARIIDATGVTLSAETAELKVGGTVTLTAEVAPENTTDKTVVWKSSDEKIATVVDGVVTAVAIGEATITATCGSVSATCKVNVVPTPVTGVTIPTPTLSLTEGETAALTANVAPADATDKTITWSSSDETVATVAADGTVTAVKAGTATITATSPDGPKAECVVTVAAKIIAVTGVTLDQTEVALTEGETATLTATVAPSDATDKTLTWTSSDAAVATVDNGVVTALKAGTATITVTTANGKTAECVVTVAAKVIEVTGVTLDKTEVALTEGETATLTATVAPADATDKTLTWTSSDATVATVENGVVTALKAGTATITVTTANGKTAECVVTVAAATVAVESITLSNTSAVLNIGESVALTATVEPENATDKTVTWTSSDTAIATVDQTGKVTAVAGGQAVITAAVGEITAECVVSVRFPEVEGYLYNRTANTWTQADLTEWVNDNSAVAQTIDGGLKMVCTNQGWNSTKEISFTNNSIVTMTATLHGGAATGRSGSYDFLKLGGVEVRMNGQDKTASVVIGEEETALTGYTRDADYEIEMTINQATKAVTVTVSGGAKGEASGKIAEQLPSNVVVGHYKAGKEGYEITEVLKAIAISEEIQVVTTAAYTINYVCNGEVIKSEEGTGVIGNEITAAATLTIDNQKYFLADGAEKTLTIEAGENILNVEMRKAYVFNYTVKNNVNGSVVEGTCTEGDKATVPYSRYILAADGTVWMKEATDKQYNYSFTPDADNFVATIEYKATEMTNGLYFAEAENLDGMTEVTGSNADIRCSNAAGGYAAEAYNIYTLKPGTYKATIGVWGNAGTTFILKAGNDTIVSAETKGYWYESASEEFILKSETALTFEGATATQPLDYILITGEAGTPVSGIAINDKDGKKIEKLEIGKGEEIQLTAEISPENAFVKDVVWTSSNEKVATVDQNGKVTAVDGGNAVITVASASNAAIKAECTVTVTVPVTGLAIWDEDDNVLDSTHSLALITGDEYTLTEVVAPTDATNQKVTWTSTDEAVAKIVDIVEEPHQVHIDAIGAGEATITASLDGFSTSFKVTVTDPVVPVTGITLDKTTAEMLTGATLKLTATIAPEDATSKEVKWTSSDNTIATVSTKGEVKALKAGKVTITATANKFTATCEITITDPYVAVTEITLNEVEISDLIEGETVQLTATVLPADATDPTVIWSSSDEKVATVDQNGKVTAVAPGSVVITAKADEATAECRITVAPRPIDVEGIVISESEVTLVKGAEFQLSYIIDPDNASDKSVTWTSSDVKVATVDQEGNVTAVDGGNAVITVASVSNPNVKAECKVTVTVPVTGLEVQDEDHNPVESGFAIDILTGNTYDLTAVVYPANATDKKVTWTSSDVEVAEVDDYGLIETHKAGEAVITASIAGFTFTANVTVTDPVIAVTGVALDKTTAELLTGETLQLTATVTPEDATVKEVGWSSSDKTIATVNSKGLVTALKAGTVTITATANKIKASCVITITDPYVAVTGIELNATEATLTEGETVKLTAAVAPENATEPTVTWSSSDVAVATVAQDGTVTAVAPGTAVITAKAGEKTATCTVTVEAAVIEVIEIILDKNEATLTEGETLQLTATVSPEDATDATVTWTSSDESVAKVDQNGLVTAVAYGEAVITAEAGDKTAECRVKVDKKSAVALIGFDPEAPVKVFDMNGIFVGDTMEGLQQGTYIVRQGNVAKKVSVKR